MPLLCANPRATPSSVRCGSSRTNASTAILSRYERIISLLSRQALLQEREIARLKAALPRAPRRGRKGCASGAGLPAKWRRAVEEEAIALLEKHLRGMDERIAQSLAERLRRVTREHVVRSIDRQVVRALREPTTLPQSGALALKTKQQGQEEEEEEEERTGCDEQSSVCGNNGSSSLIVAEALQRQVALLELRLAEAARSAMGATTHEAPLTADATAVTAVEPLPIGGAGGTLPPPPSTTMKSDERYDNCDSWRWHSSSCLLTNSADTSSLSDNIDTLLDVFQGRQPIEAVQQLLA